MNKHFISTLSEELSDMNKKSNLLTQNIFDFQQNSKLIYQNDAENMKRSYLIFKVKNFILKFIKVIL